MKATEVTMPTLLHRLPHITAALALLAPTATTAPELAAQQVTESAYARAEQFLPWNASNLISGDQVVPEFFDGDRFWFRSRTSSGHEFVVVDPAAATRQPAFDHARLAAALSVAADTAYEGRTLPFDEFDFVNRGAAIRFQVADSVQWTCDIGAYTCAGPTNATAPSDADRPSPDGRWIAFARDENLWVRDAASGAETQLTRDGETDFGYGAIPEGCCQEITSRRANRERSPVMQWSPDSRRIATHRYDEREVERFHLLEAADGRPILHSWAYALPGDSVVPTSELWILDVEAGTSVRANVPPQPGNFARGDTAFADVQWTADGSHVFYTHRSRDFKSYRLYRVDAATGSATELLEETGPTYVELNNFTSFAPAWQVLGNGSEFLWWSERDGFGHLYLYDGDGNLRNRVTSGPWLVAQLLQVDEASRTVYFTAAGREEGRHPYHLHLYRVGLDGSGLQLLSSEDAVHQITPAPSGRYFVDQYSTPGMAPTAVVRGRDGRIVQTIETADISRLEEAGWIPPVPFEAKGRDGTTSVYGLLWFPSDFDPAASYPVVDYIYPGPQIGAVTRYDFSAAGRGNGRALAELGFIVFAVDAFGTPLRSKAFHDAYYANMGDNGIPDHISALKELAGRYPQMDLDRVGIFGHSGGGFSSTDAILRWPDFFKVAVSGAGNHDNRGYHFPWAEKYQGLLVENEDGTDNYDNQANQNLAANLKGKLLLHYGTLDDNVHPNMTVRVIDELIAHNKDFDMFVLPNRNHGYANEPYVVRRTWDYFIEHLRGEVPPSEYRITGPGG
ncbi:MAG: prolyl oligopeptidase family serine peptidase [Gemmatimonadetes bacterium]|nr:prolyl oligopeptidase family serine peptidase [Gemmatimonadota bacterium]